MSLRKALLVTVLTFIGFACLLAKPWFVVYGAKTHDIPFGETPVEIIGALSLLAALWTIFKPTRRKPGPATHCSRDETK
jgi:hypothetical protein